MTDTAQIVRILSYHGFILRSSPKGLIVRPHPGPEHQVIPVIKRHRDALLEYVSECVRNGMKPEEEAFVRRW